MNNYKPLNGKDIEGILGLHKNDLSQLSKVHLAGMGYAEGAVHNREVI